MGARDRRLLTLYYSSNTTVLLEAGSSPVSRDASMRRRWRAILSTEAKHNSAAAGRRHNTGSLTAGAADGAPITRSNEETEMREIREQEQSQEDEGSLFPEVAGQVKPLLSGPPGCR
jgi:hypothetical protein